MGSVSSILPSGFDAYARVLHPITVTRYRPLGRGNVQEDYSEESWTWADVAAHTQSVIHPQVQWIRVAGHQYQSLELPGNRSADPPPLGHLAPRIMARVMDIARGYTNTTEEITVALWEGWGIGLQPAKRGTDPALLRLLRNGPFLELPWRRYVLLATTALDLTDPAWPFTAGMGWSPGVPGPMPQLVWPADHAWAVASEIDFDSTLVGGTFGLINAIVEHPDIEAVRVSATTDLTWDSDDVNRPA